MWETLDRARRRLLGDEPSPSQPAPAAVEPAADLTYALGRPELERLITALTGSPGAGERPDTPARLETALREAFDRVAGRGSPAVTRRPAGLYTPETWQIEIAGADERARAVLERAMRGGEAV